MNRRSVIWVAVLRPYDNDILPMSVMSLSELAQDGRRLELTMRYNPDIRLVTMRLPPGTRREQVFEAFDRLTDDERSRLYRLPQHPLASA